MAENQNKTHFEEENESLGIISDLSNSILHHASSLQKRDSAEVNNVRDFSVSLEDISLSRVSGSVHDSESTKSSSNCNLRKRRKNEYRHVESKVKLYRLEMQKQQKRNKKKEDSESQTQSNNTTENGTRENLELDTLLGELEVYKERFAETNLSNQILNKQVIDLMKENADIKIRMDYLRLEAQRYKNMLTSVQQHIHETPIPKRTNRNSQLSLLRTPIRTLSRTLLTPFRNLHKSSTPDAEKDSSQADSDDEEFQNAEYHRKCLSEQKAVQFYDLSSASLTTSDVPLTTSKSINFTTRARIRFLHLITCFKHNNTETETEKIHMKKIKNNKIYPLAPAKFDKASGSHRIIKIRTENNDLQIPTIIIGTPTSESTSKLLTTD